MNNSNHVKDILDTYLEELAKRKRGPRVIVPINIAEMAYQTWINEEKKLRKNIQEEIIRLEMNNGIFSCKNRESAILKSNRKTVAYRYYIDKIIPWYSKSSKLYKNYSYYDNWDSEHSKTVMDIKSDIRLGKFYGNNTMLIISEKAYQILSEYAPFIKLFGINVKDYMTAKEILRKTFKG